MKGWSLLTLTASTRFLRPPGHAQGWDLGFLLLGSSTLPRLRPPSAGRSSPGGRAQPEKGRGRPRLHRPSVRALELGEPRPAPAGEPPVAWALIVGKLDAPGKVQVVEGGLRFLLNFPGLPGRPPPPFLTKL